MARKSSQTNLPVVGSPTIEPHTAIGFLERQYSKGISLQENSNLSEEDFDVWDSVTGECVSNAFGSKTENAYKFLYTAPPSRVSYMGDGRRIDPLQTRKDMLQHKLSALNSLIQVLQLQVELKQTPPLKSTDTLPSQISSDVFIVHGHDESALQSVARFIEHLKLHPIILHEQPNKGRTLIEKFEEHSNVGFAVVLLTPDDRGGLSSESFDDHKPRARQNVILELGFFLGKLGRERVCALYGRGVEIPSDYDGVVFVPLDEAGAWRLSLAKELKAVGYNIDMNLAI